jgi:hypothetical protein
MDGMCGLVSRENENYAANMPGKRLQVTMGQLIATGLKVS